MIISLLKAFIVGGLICVVGQILVDKTKITAARIMVSFLIAGIVLSAIGLYKPLVDFAGAGATVPISGFGHLLAQGAKKAVDKNGLIGVIAGGLAAGAAGISAAMFFGLLASFAARPRSK